MAYFHIDTDKAINSSQDIVSIAVKLNEIKDSLENVKLSGIIESSSGALVGESIHKLVESISDEAVKMNSLGDALQMIADKYRETEKTISNMAGMDSTNAMSNAEAGTDKRNWWDKFWDWITRKEPDEYDTTTDEQEKAANDAMKNRLWNTLQDEKYSQENWDNASVDERKKILQDYMGEVIDIYGLQDVKPDIHWDSDATYSDQSITWGYYSNSTRVVTLNEQALSDSVSNWDSYDLLETVSHELRHAYQHEAISHPTRYMVSNETVDIWRRNFANYIDSDVDYRGYRAQPVEVDARDFQVNR